MSDPADIRLLLSDVDGTLVTHDKVVTPAAVIAAEALRAAGIGLTVTSARPPWGLRMLIEPLGLTLPLAGYNGGLIVDPDSKVLERHPIDPGAARIAVKLLQDQGLDVWLYTEDAWFVPAADAPHVARETWILKTDPGVVSVFSEDQLDHAYKIVGCSDDHPKVAAAEPVVQAALGGTASATRSEAHFLDVTNPMATKGFVVHALARHMGITPARIATIGDMANDVLMFKESGFSIAMGNAADDVKTQACAVTDSNEAEGFAKAVRRFLLRSDAA